MSGIMPGKRETLLDYLQRGVAMLHLDARRAGVLVPPQFGGDAHLRLNLSYRYGIPDLSIGEERVVATLSFGGRPFQCVLPWPAIFAITSHTSGDLQVWPDDVPLEVMETLAARPGSPGSDAPPQRAPAARPPLHAVITDPEPEPVAAPRKPEPPDGSAKRPHLRLVR